MRIGLVELGQRFQEEAVQAAYHAGIPAPSFEAECVEDVSWIQAIEATVRNVLLTPSLSIQGLWRCSFLLASLRLCH
jgi:hypothetical protein